MATTDLDRLYYQTKQHGTRSFQSEPVFEALAPLPAGVDHTHAKYGEAFTTRKHQLDSYNEPIVRQRDVPGVEEAPPKPSQPAKYSDPKDLLRKTLRHTDAYRNFYDSISILD